MSFSVHKVTAPAAALEGCWPSRRRKHWLHIMHGGFWLKERMPTKLLEHTVIWLLMWTSHVQPWHWMFHGTVGADWPPRQLGDRSHHQLCSLAMTEALPRYFLQFSIYSTYKKTNCTYTSLNSCFLEISIKPVAKEVSINLDFINDPDKPPVSLCCVICRQF